MPQFAVILPAAGSSSRFGGEVRKVFHTLLGMTVWEYSARLFAARHDVTQILLVLAKEDREAFLQEHGDAKLIKSITVVPGGSERFESVANALTAVEPTAQFVAIHDAARPCLSPDLVETVFTRATATGAAMLAVPVGDTVKRAGVDGRVLETVPRQGLWLAQTPQVFRRDWLVEAYANRKRLGEAITDDAQLIEAAGHAVHLVPGSTTNIKITRPEDLRLAEAILRLHS